MEEQDLWENFVEFSGDNKYSAAALMGFLDASGGSFTKEDIEQIKVNMKSRYEDTYNSLKNAKSVDEASGILVDTFVDKENEKADYKSYISSRGGSYYSTYNKASSSSQNSQDSTTTTNQPTQPTQPTQPNLSDSTSNSLSDETLEIHPNNLNDVCQQWEKSVVQADLSSINVEGAFSPLTSAGVGVSYIPTLATALKKIETSLLSASKMISSAVEEQVGVDDTYNNRVTGGNSYSGGNQGGRNSGNGGNNLPSGGNNPTGGGDDKPPTEPPTDDPKKKIKINKNFINKINTLDSDSYIAFITALGSILKGNMSDYLTDEDKAGKLKKKILESPNIDADLKKIISEMDENEIQITLKSLITEKTKFSDVTKEIIYNYTEELVQSSLGLTPMISKNSEFLKQVDVIFDTLQSTIKRSDNMETLLKIYDGDVPQDSKKETADFVRSAFDTMAKKLNVNTSDFFTNNSYNGIVIDQMKDLSKSLGFLKMTNNCLGEEQSLKIFDSIMS